MTLSTEVLSETASRAAENSTASGIEPRIVVILVILAVSSLIALFSASYVIKCRKQAKSRDSAAQSDSTQPADSALTRRSTVSVMLVACSGYMSGRMFTFRRELFIGRDSSVCTVVYPQKIQRISGLHCKLYVESGGVFLADLDSACGTYLENGERIAAHFPVRLTTGAKFYVADPENMFEVRI